MRTKFILSQLALFIPFFLLTIATLIISFRIPEMDNMVVKGIILVFMSFCVFMLSKTIQIFFKEQHNIILKQKFGDMKKIWKGQIWVLLVGEDNISNPKDIKLNIHGSAELDANSQKNLIITVARNLPQVDAQFAAEQIMKDTGLNPTQN